MLNQDLSGISTGNMSMDRPSYEEPTSSITRGNPSGDDDIWMLQGPSLSTESLCMDDEDNLVPYIFMGAAPPPPVLETRPEWQSLALVERETVIGAETKKRPLPKAPSIHTLTSSSYDLINNGGAINLKHSINSSLSFQTIQMDFDLLQSVFPFLIPFVQMFDKRPWFVSFEKDKH